MFPLKDVHLNIFTKDKSEPTLNVFRGVRSDGEWVNVRAVMDSGASESVAPSDMCPQYKIMESESSRAGVSYRSASNDKIPNLGEQLLNIVMEDGRGSRV